LFNGSCPSSSHTYFRQLISGVASQALMLAADAKGDATTNGNMLSALKTELGQVQTELDESKQVYCAVLSFCRHDLPLHIYLFSAWLLSFTFSFLFLRRTPFICSWHFQLSLHTRGDDNGFRPLAATSSQYNPSQDFAGAIKLVSDSATANAALLQTLSLELKTQEGRIVLAEKNIDAAVGRITELEKVYRLHQASEVSICARGAYSHFIGRHVTATMLH
jgi:hypothetical protein